MIPSTLKVGDKFTDGNRTLEVLSVVEHGVYISKVIDVKTPETSFVANVVEKTKEMPKYTKTDINRTPKEELEKICDELKLEKGTTSDMKKEIIELLGL